jgi:CTP synthase
MRLCGVSPDGQLVEIIELAQHPWFVGCQFHPELKSRPTRAHPLFAGFIGAAAAGARSKRQRSDASPSLAKAKAGE